jgi:hypothetical protein
MLDVIERHLYGELNGLMDAVQVVKEVVEFVWTVRPDDEVIGRN